MFLGHNLVVDCIIFLAVSRFTFHLFASSFGSRVDLYPSALLMKHSIISLKPSQINLPFKSSYSVMGYRALDITLDTINHLLIQSLISPLKISMKYSCSWYVVPCRLYPSLMGVNSSITLGWYISSWIGI